MLRWGWLLSIILVVFGWARSPCVENEGSGDEQQINKKQQTRNKKHKNKDLYCNDRKAPRGPLPHQGTPHSWDLGCDGAGVKQKIPPAGRPPSHHVHLGRW